MATLVSCRFNYLELAKKFLLSTIAENLTFSYIKVMSDVISMFITYLLELYTWSNDNDTLGMVRGLWPQAQQAAQWQLNITQSNGYLPTYLVSTDDILGLDSYKYVTYNGAFHLLAMKAAEKLAYLMGRLGGWDGRVGGEGGVSDRRVCI
ncbi:hypothetical protein EMCRGX_G030750 [Ephydatia muelleri]